MHRRLNSVSRQGRPDTNAVNAIRESPSIDSTAATQLVACFAYALALRFAQAHDGNVIARVVGDWVGLLEALPRWLAARGSPLDSPPEDASPCWRCHLVGFSIASMGVFCLRTRRYWTVWSKRLEAKLRRNYVNDARIIELATLGRRRMVLAAFAAIFLVLFPSAPMSGDWYFLVGPAAATAAGYMIASYFILQRLAKRVGLRALRPR